MKKRDIVWSDKHPQARTASLIDPRLGFACTYAYIGLSEIAPGSKSGRHKHGEAMIYILKRRGYSVMKVRSISGRMETPFTFRPMPTTSISTTIRKIRSYF